LPCRRKCAVGKDGRPLKRCYGHGSAPGSGQQTESGRRSIGESTRRRMKAFWSEWKAKGKPPIVRGCIRVGQAKRAPVSKSSLPRAFFRETPEQRRARILADLKRRFPDRDWS
jgi:hypothetical protein